MIEHLMYQAKLCSGSVASQWLYNDMNLPLSWMDRLIQITTGVKPGLDRPTVLGFGGWGLGYLMYEVTLYSVAS